MTMKFYNKEDDILDTLMVFVIWSLVSLWSIQAASIGLAVMNCMGIVLLSAGKVPLPPSKAFIGRLISWAMGFYILVCTYPFTQLFITLLVIEILGQFIIRRHRRNEI
jgi:hypothetical protein